MCNQTSGLGWGVPVNVITVAVIHYNGVIIMPKREGAGTCGLWYSDRREGGDEQKHRELGAFGKCGVCVRLGWWVNCGGW